MLRALEFLPWTFQASTAIVTVVLLMEPGTLVITCNYTIYTVIYTVTRLVGLRSINPTGLVEVSLWSA